MTSSQAESPSATGAIEDQLQSGGPRRPLLLLWEAFSPDRISASGRLLPSHVMRYRVVASFQAGVGDNPGLSDKGVAPP